MSERDKAAFESAPIISAAFLTLGVPSPFFPLLPFRRIAVKYISPSMNHGRLNPYRSCSAYIFGMPLPSFSIIFASRSAGTYWHISASLVFLVLDADRPSSLTEIPNNPPGLLSISRSSSIIREIVSMLYYHSRLANFSSGCAKLTKFTMIFFWRPA